MQIGKSLLLGSAAGLMAVTAGQAADLPVKAKPVEYVKVCSLYGAGFFYIPGTDKCIKLGGYMREQWDIHAAGDESPYLNSQARWTRGDTSDSSFRTRTNFTIDVREQSAYGTIRGYTSFGAQQTTGSDTFNSAIFFTRSFVQFAGFTGGRAVSFFDLISFDPYSFSNARAQLGNTGATGINVFAYTWQLGNGASFSISAEDGCEAYPGAASTAAFSSTASISNTSSGAFNSDRGCSVINASGGNPLGLGSATVATEGRNIPDVVASLRVDQAWGTAQVMGAYHKVAASYYYSGSSTAGDSIFGHPDDKAGWAVGAGFVLNNVLGMQGDQFGIMGTFTEGAVAYLTTNGTGGLEGFSGGNNVTFGHVVDGIYSSSFNGSTSCSVSSTGACGTDIALTTGYQIGGVYEHHWSPQWKTSIYGAFVKVMYSDTAASYYCTGGAGYNRGSTGGTSSGAVSAGTWLAGSSCDPNTTIWNIGTRTMWNPNSNLDLGVDFLWTQLSNSSSGSLSLGTQGNLPAGVYNISSTYHNYAVALRAQYNFLP
jgi:Porin subfamily